MSRAPAIAVAAALLSACQPRPPPPKPSPIELCTPQVVFAFDLGAYPVQTGVEKQIPQALLVTGCDGGTLGGLAASARVIDASGAVVPSQVSLHTGGPNDPDWFLDDGDGGTLVVATVTFTPPARGIYLGSVRFEPSLGTQQFEAYTVDESRDGGSHHAAVNGPCFGFDLLGDVWVCQNGNTIWTSTGAALPGTSFAVDGPDLWAVADTGVVVAQFGDGGTLYIQASAPLPSGFVSLGPVLLAKGGEALLVAMPQVYTVKRSASGLDVALVANLPAMGAFGVQWSPGDGAIIGDGLSFCSFGFDSVHPLSCTTRNVVGSDGDLLWTKDGPALSAWRIDGGVPEQVPVEGFDGFNPLVDFAGILGEPFSVSGAELVMPTRDPAPRLADYGRITPVGSAERFAGPHLYWQQLPGVNDVEYVAR